RAAQRCVPVASRRRLAVAEHGEIHAMSTGFARQSGSIRRRDFLRLGALGLGALGHLTLADMLKLCAAEAGSSAKAVIMVWLYGGPSHIDMYDLKPDAPKEYRGEFKPIQTNVSGLDICELMPLQARMADKFALIRNMKFQNFKQDDHSRIELQTGS